MPTKAEGVPSTPSSLVSCPGRKHMDTMLSLFAELGVPVAEDKTCGSAQVVSCLGIEIDVLASEIGLPSDKLKDLLSLLQQ